MFRHRWTKFAISLLLGGAVFALLLTRVSLHDVAQALESSDWKLVLLTLALGLVVTYLRVLRYLVFFPQRGRWLELYGMFSLLRLLNFAIPFRLGEVITLGILKRRGLAPTIAETAPLWMALRVMDVVALAILFAVCACLGIPGEHVGRLTVALAVGAISATGLLLAAGLFVWRVRLEQWAWLSKRLADARSGFKRLSNFKSLIVAWLIALAIWATMSILVTTAQLAFGTPLPFATCALIAVGILAVSVLPIHGPLGIGSVDTALAGMMILAGLSTEPAVAITLCVRMLLVGCVLIDGLIGWVLLHAFPARQLYVGEEPT